MFSSKVIGSFVVVFVTAAVALFLHLSGAAKDAATTQLGDRLRLAQRMVDQSRRLNDYALSARAAEVAHDAALADVLAASRESYVGADGKPLGDDDYLYEQHKKMNEVVARWQGQFVALSEGRETARPVLADARVEKPDYFVVVDRGGVGVAKADDKAWFGPADADLGKTFPSLLTAVNEGRSVLDIWTMKDTPMVVAIEPVKRGEATLGAIIVGYWLTAAEAKRDQASGLEVAYYVGDKVRQSSTLAQTGEAALTAALKVDALPTKAGSREPIVFTLGERKQLGFVSRIVGRPSAAQAGYVVFGDLDRFMSAAVEPAYSAPVILLFVGLAAIGLVLLFFRQYAKHYDEIDQGILEIINGNADRWFEAPKTHPAGGMSQNLNIMICKLTGRPLPDEEEGGAARSAHATGEAWAEDRVFIESLNASELQMKIVDTASADAQSGLSPEVLRLVRETEDAYRKRLFVEYIAALRSAGEPTPTVEQFSASIQSNADALRNKIGCARVRFLVIAGEGRVTLKPVPMN